jgi:hypothetical protein
LVFNDGKTHLIKNLEENLMGEETNYGGGGREQQEDIIRELTMMRDKALIFGDYEDAERYSNQIQKALKKINYIDTKTIESTNQLTNTIIESGKELINDVVAPASKQFWGTCIGQMDLNFKIAKNTLGGMGGAGGGTTGAASLGSVAIGGLISVAGIVALRSIKSTATKNPKPDPRLPHYFKYLSDWIIYAGTQIKNNGGNMKGIRKVKTFEEWLKNSAI